VAKTSPAYEAKKFRVERLDVPAADGTVHTYDIVTHSGAAVVLPLLDDGRVVLIHNHRPAVDAQLLELPAGTLDDAEPPIECARRELAEETGYRAGRLEPLVSFYSTPGICNERLHAFLATDLTPGRTQHEPTERIRVVPLEYAEAMQAIGDSRIVDAKTMVTLLYYDRYIRGRETG
jgi:ADP-ribose pyrophosphatase